MPDDTSQLNQRLEQLEQEVFRNRSISRVDNSIFSDFGRGNLRIPHRDSTPSTCQIGELCEVSGVFYECYAENTWRAVGTREVVLRVLPSDVNQATGTIIGGDFEIPFGGTITSIGAYVDTAGTTGSGTYDVNINGSTILSTKITVETGEKSSRNAATQPVFSASGLVVGDILTVDIDAIQTTPAKGLTIRFTVTPL